MATADEGTMPMRTNNLILSCGFLGCIGVLSTCSSEPGTTATVTVTVAGGGSVASLPAGINCGTDCSEDVAIGSQLTLTATPDASFTFAGWSGGGCTGIGTCTLTVAADTAVTATFVADQMLTIVPSGTGMGRVIASPGGIDCGADCSELYLRGSVVTLSAMADASSRFTGWSGAGCSGTGTCVVTMDQAQQVTATFALNRYQLAVVRNGIGTGSVRSIPSGIDCNADCAEDYDHGTTVTLTATPEVGSTFIGWSGGSCTGTGDCEVTLVAATQVTANFAVNQEGLGVMKIGNGSGTVTSSPAGINCGADCQEFYTYGTMVTLTATPAVGSVFSGWSGGGCTGTGTCTVTITASTTVTATFTLTSHSLSTSNAGNGVGSVSSSPAGITCGADCTEVYNYGTVVTLMASPAVGTTFTGWSGAGCTGAGTCTVTVTQALSVTATFTLNTYLLSVTKSGTGTGTVTSSPAGVNCGADCTEVYNHGTVVTLTATPGVSSAFAGWSGGGCAGTGTCVVTMAAATTVTATFSPCGSGSVTYAYTGAMQTFTVPACVSSVTVDAYGAQGGASTGENGGLNFSGGLGARVRGTFAVSGGQVLNILVGGQGANNNCGGAGGGGSFVLRTAVMPPTAADIMLIAAGGGGAMHCNYYGGTNGGGGQITSNGGSGVASMGGNPVPACVAGGSSGGGGTLNGFGGGGGGFLTNGQSVYDASGGGKSLVTGGAGGSTGGGFGGGGGRYAWCCGGGGGGGGYSGGGGSSIDGCAGGGGGSLNNGTVQTNAAAVRSGNGTVIISY